MSADANLRNVRLAIALAVAAATMAFRGAAWAAPTIDCDDNPHGDDGAPAMDPAARPIPVEKNLFGPDPVYGPQEYDAQAQIDIYGGKYAVNGPRPLLEIGRALYGSGALGTGIPLLGDMNRFFPQVLLFGDWRTAVAFNDLGKDKIAVAATQLNLNLDVKLTATERVHIFWKPLERGADITRVEFDRTDNKPEKSVVIFNPEPVTAFFEGDLGAISSNFTNAHAAFDAPVAFGRLPLLFQNGVWLEDAMLGVAATIPARHIGSLDVSNFDITVFAAFDEVTTPAFRNARGGLADHAGHVYGAKGFFDTREGYLEVGYAYLSDRREAVADFSYHNLSVAFTRRYGGWLSNSVRVIANFGQDPGPGRTQTADGWLVLVENSLVTRKPSTLIPYVNVWYGSDQPQSVARAGAAGGVLRNTGLAFETDGMTGFPKLDDSARDTYGGAIGLEYLFDLGRQVVVEAAALDTHGARVGAPVQGPQAAFSVRAQQPLSDRWILRADAVYGVRDELDDIAGIRVELRRKF